MVPPNLSFIAKPMRTVIALMIFFCLTACNRTAMQHQEAYVFGTRVEVLIAGSDAEQGRKAISTVLREFDRMHATYHAWKPSELSALNEALRTGKQFTSNPEMATFIRDAQNLSRQGDHLFDPGIGRMIELWGFQSDEFKAKIPAPTALAECLKSKPSIADIEIEGNVIRTRNMSVKLDFGGYLKGVALDRAAEILKREGINNALINIGGNVMVLGNKYGRKWKVGIQHPRGSGPLAAIELSDGEAIGTSGDYQRFFEIDGKRYPHLIDPRSAWPATHTQAVSILIPAGNRTGTLSDAISKPIFIAGREHWRKMARQLGADYVLRVGSDGKVQVTEKMRLRIETMETVEVVQ